VPLSHAWHVGIKCSFCVGFRVYVVGEVPVQLHSPESLRYGN